MSIRIFLLLTLMLLLAACNLSTDDSGDVPTNTPQSISQNPTRTTAPVVTNTSQPQQPTATSTQRVVVTLPATVTNCVPRNDWTAFYTVVSGDTLGTIAQRVNSNISTLQQGNCLADANRIVVGQVLRVPQAPLPPTATRTPIIPTPTHTPQNTQPRAIGGLGMNPYITADAGNFQLLRDSVVRLTWDGVPTGEIGMVTFAIMSGDWLNNFSNNFTAIGYDNNPLDGIMFDWKVPASLAGVELMAFAYHKTTGQLFYSYQLYAYSGPSADQGCHITLTANTALYNQPTGNSTVYSTLAAGETHQILGRSNDGWFAIIPELAYQTLVPVEMNVNGLRWLPRDGAYKMDGIGCPEIF